MKTLLLILIYIIVSTQAYSQRYYEFRMRSQDDSQSFIVITSDSAAIAQVNAQLALPESQRRLHITGKIDYGNGGFNKNWSWHFVPDVWKLTDISVELCDGAPSYVQENLDYFIKTVGYYCPWNSYVSREVNLSGVWEANRGDESYSVFPNPARNYISFRLPYVPKHDIIIRLFDYTGTEVLRTRMEPISSEGTVYFNNLPSGVYNLQILSEGNIFNYKIDIVQ